MMERDKSDIRFTRLDTSFNPNPVHLSIMKEARLNNGIYDRRKTLEKIQTSLNEDRLKKQMISWNSTNIATLINAGYLIKKDDDCYIANPLAFDARKKEFVPGKNYINLLKKNNNGIIKTIELRKQYKDKSLKEQKRQKSMVDGMIKKLADNGYIKQVDRGEYRITELGQNLITLNKAPPSMQNKRTRTDKNNFTVTSFDRHIVEVTNNGKIDRLLLNEHDRSSSIIKRLGTLKRVGLILEDGTVSKDFFLLLERQMKLSRNDLLSIDKFTKEQLCIISDMRYFFNLSKQQIQEYIYNGESNLAEIDLGFLVKSQILKRDEDTGIFILDKVGIDLTNDLFPNAVKYSTKLYSKKQEIEHDMLVYTSYKEWEKDILKKGGTIVEIKNDRQLRSDDAKIHGHMVGSYPDLRVFYKMPGVLEQLIYDIEVDCGYDGKTIRNKLEGLTSTAIGKKNKNLGWYCKTMSQAYKVIKSINNMTKDTTKVSRMNVARKATVFFMDKDGNLKTVRHSYWDK